MAKRTVGNVIWLALVCAKQDRDALIDAYRGDKIRAGSQGCFGGCSSVREIAVEVIRDH